jgi:hypothetical protein
MFCIVLSSERYCGPRTTGSSLHAELYKEPFLNHTMFTAARRAFAAFGRQTRPSLPELQHPALSHPAEKDFIEHSRISPFSRPLRSPNSTARSSTASAAAKQPPQRAKLPSSDFQAFASNGWYAAPRVSLRPQPLERTPHKRPQVPSVQKLIGRFPGRVVPARQHLRHKIHAMLGEVREHLA